MIVHRLAWFALVAVIVLVIAGATVRVTGSGLGCPDWPTCWGCLIPPTSVEQINVDKLDLEKFKKHAARKGIDPDMITRETVLDSFDPVHTWIEFSNRLASLPLGIATLLLALFSFGAKQEKGLDHRVGLVLLVGRCGQRDHGRDRCPEWLAARRHYAAHGLGISLDRCFGDDHLAFPPGANPAKKLRQSCAKKLQIVSLIFFTCLFGEGLLGSQLRERTDELAMTAETEQGIEREKWGEELGATMIYKSPPQFFLELVVDFRFVVFLGYSGQRAGKTVEPKLIFAMVIAMMLMGVVLGHIAIFAVVQVLHVGMTAIIVGRHLALDRAGLWSTKPLRDHDLSSG